MATKNITGEGRIKKVSETIVSVDSGLAPESLYVVALNFDEMDRLDYLRLARACLGKEPVRVTFTLAQTELPLSADGQTVTSAYYARPAPFPGVA